MKPDPIFLIRVRLLVCFQASQSISRFAKQGQDSSQEFKPLAVSAGQKSMFTVSVESVRHYGNSICRKGQCTGMWGLGVDQDEGDRSVAWPQTQNNCFIES